MLRCAVCDKQLKQITRNHLVRHHMTVAEYTVMFPSAPLQDESIIMRGARNAFFGKHHTEECKQRQRDHFSGKPLREETKRKLSALWSDPEGVYRKMMSSETYRRTLSSSLTNWWSTSDRQVTRVRFDKMRETNVRNGRWLLPEEKEPFIAYRDKVRLLSEESFRSNFYELENSSLRGKGYELDHVLSIYEGFKHNVPENVMANVRNLRMITSHDNKIKGRNSSKTSEELMFEVDNEI
mgnify:CR=1 FL=1